MSAYSSNKESDLTTKQNGKLKFKGADNRYLPRWTVENNILCSWEDQKKSVRCTSVDISCSGICLLVKEDIPLQNKLTLKIFLNDDVVIKVKGDVIWKRNVIQGMLLGVHFENTSQRVQDLILEYAYEIKRKDIINHWYKGWNAK